MKAYLQGFLFAVTVAGAYFFIDARFFNLDNLKSVRNSFFHLFKSQTFADENIILYNTGTLSDTAVINRINFLLTFKPKVIGINACDLENYKTFAEAFARVFFGYLLDLYQYTAIENLVQICLQLAA